MPCRECGKTVSTEAVSCPQCGAVSPTGLPAQQQAPTPAAKTKPGAVLQGLLGLVLVFVLVKAFSGSSDRPVGKAGDDGSSHVYTDTNIPASTNPLALAPTHPPAPTCKKDWHACKDNADVVNSYDGWSMVQVRCKDSAKESAKYGTPDFPWFSFGTFTRGDDYVKTGIATSIEQDAQFSNGFGAMVHSRVVCLYDLNKGTVLNVTTQPNR